MASLSFIGLFVILAYFVPIPLVTVWLHEHMASQLWLSRAFAVVLLFMMTANAGLIVFAVSAKGREHTYVIPKEMGRLEISHASIRSFVGHSLESISDVKSYFVQLKGELSPQDVRIELEVEPKSRSVDLEVLGAQVQEVVQRDLEKCLAIEAQNIHVKIKPVFRTDAQGRPGGKSNVPRVV